MRGFAAAAAVILVLAGGCGGSGEVRLRPQEGRELRWETVSEIEVQGDGLLAPNSKTRRTLVWNGRIGRQTGPVRQIDFRLDKLEEEGDPGAPTRLPGEAAQAARNLLVQLQVDERGRTLGVSWNDQDFPEGPVRSAFAAISSTMRLVGPWGVILPPDGESEWPIEADLSLSRPSSEPPEEARIYRLVFRRGETVTEAGRQALRITFRGEAGDSFSSMAGEVPASLTTEGEAWVDRRTGLPLRIEWKSVTQVKADHTEFKMTETGTTRLLGRPE
ncbi:MAG: hypothetical protein MH204_00250 [Fimbriimonadaceae bacterium]|nr:hypothetical protein [Fimbriimonadaceae bacterium]